MSLTEASLSLSPVQSVVEKVGRVSIHLQDWPAVYFEVRHVQRGLQR